MFRFVLAVMATWRVSSLLVNEPGPYSMFRKIRERFGIIEDDEGTIVGYNQDNVVGMALTCVWCTSLWVAPVIFLFSRKAPIINEVLALSAGTILIQTQVE